jgi:hypothetical protein
LKEVEDPQLMLVPSAKQRGQGICPRLTREPTLCAPTYKGSEDAALPKSSSLAKPGKAFDKFP